MSEHGERKERLELFKVHRRWGADVIDGIYMGGSSRFRVGGKGNGGCWKAAHGFGFFLF